MDFSDPAFQLEIAANVAAAASILLAGRNSVHGWWMSIIAGLLFAVVFLQARLYGQVALQGFFIAVGALGWWQWLRGNQGAPLPITRLRASAWPWLVLLVLAGTWGYGWMLSRHTDGQAPYVDAGILLLSMVGQLMMMRRKLECWWVWLLVNTLAVPLYYAGGLQLTALLYVGYWINAIVALLHWRRLMVAAR
ncbi:MAG: nicotinamide riboside transporter PnuC [Stenotrophomonas chelatiphaga]